MNPLLKRQIRKYLPKDLQQIERDVVDRRAVRGGDGLQLLPGEIGERGKRREIVVDMRHGFDPLQIRLAATWPNARALQGGRRRVKGGRSVLIEG